MFADYVFYEEVFHGDILTGEEFPKYADRADVWLEYFTRGRVSRPDLPETVLTAVKKAECDVADALRMSGPPSADRDSAVQKETVKEQPDPKPKTETKTAKAPKSAAKRQNKK